ncbi:hypothetical protein PIB30_059614 [Stylosanthes scabra]|uniref:Protein SRG1-like n=1 Tax=Stylosanthes scabra TaxID=79078 RepID=A0ABU6QKW8_9FABA|nr:hypothetical protein [Stylosanthes scabra]
MDFEMSKKVGTSIIVPSVQELAKKPISEIPDRYVHPNQDPVIVSNITSSHQVPVVDLSKLLSDDSSELEKLDHACKEWGFFQTLWLYKEPTFNTIHKWANIEAEALESYSLELKKLCVKLLELMAKALNINPNELLQFVDKGLQAMRLNYYPPCPQQDKVIGLNPHSDAVLLTIL